MTAEQLRLRDGAAEWVADGSEVVVLDLDRAWYVGLNASAALLWAELARGTTRTRMIALLSERYGLDRTQAEGDVDTFVAECARRGLMA